MHFIKTVKEHKFATTDPDLFKKKQPKGKVLLSNEQHENVVPDLYSNVFTLKLVFPFREKKAHNLLSY